MIVNYIEDGWQIITQRAHGLLAAQICAHWCKANQPARWVDTLIATAEHDDVYNEFENDHLVNENGGPLNFKVMDFRKEYGERLIAMAATKSAYIALLVAKHIRFVHGSDPKATSFIKELAKSEKKWLKQGDVSVTEVDEGYGLLQFCDAFSLLICQYLIQPEGRKIEISEGPDGKVYEMHQQGNSLIVEPWPFDVDSFQVTYESRMLNELSFRDTAHFRKTIQGAETTIHYLRMSRANI